MKKYLFFVGTLSSGGAERVISILSSKMADCDMCVEILTYYDMPIFYEIHSKVRVSCIEQLTGTKNKIKNLIWLRKYFKENAKVVISFLAPFNMMALVANLFTGIPIIVADRNDPTRVPTNIVLRKIRDYLYHLADGVVLQTKKNQAYFSKKVQQKSVVIYNPINLGKYSGAALNNEKDKVFVTAGRLMPQKNQETMIKAFAKVVKRYPDYRLKIFGDGPSREKLEQLIKSQELENNIFLPGNTKSLHEEIKNARAFVLSSDYEGMPNALIEAMCLGLPVISTKVSGATDLIKDHENGLLIEISDEEALAHSMLELIEKPELAEKLAKNAVKINNLLELNEIMAQWIQFIEKTTVEKQ